MSDTHHNPNTGTRHAGTFATCLWDTCIQARAEQQEHDVRTRAAAYREAADIAHAEGERLYSDMGQVAAAGAWRVRDHLRARADHIAPAAAPTKEPAEKHDANPVQYGIQHSDGTVQPVGGDRFYAASLAVEQRVRTDPAARVVQRTITPGPWTAVPTEEPTP